MGPHDRFFRYLFHFLVRAAALLRHHLPASLAARLDWSTLYRESGTLVDCREQGRALSASRISEVLNEPAQ